MKLKLTGEQKLVITGHLFVTVAIIIVAVVTGLSQWLRGQYRAISFLPFDLLLDVGPFRVCSTKFNLCSSISIVKKDQELTTDKLLMTARVGVLVFILFTFVGIVLSGSISTPSLQGNEKLRIASIVFVTVGMAGGILALIVLGVWKNKYQMSFRVAYFLTVVSLALAIIGIPMLYPNRKRISLDFE